LPFYYGWVIVSNTVIISFSTRTVMAVAVLSVFVVPMTKELEWSRGLFSGAVSLGGLCAVVIAPLIGHWVDRYGAGVLISASSLVTGVLAIGLAFVTLPWAFYILYVPGRMIFSGPLELGIPTAISNWFIRRRSLGLAVDTIAKGAGLSVMPLVAQLIIGGWGWRTAWTAIGVFTLAVGVVPCLLLMARRPEDMGLEPDPVPQKSPRAEETVSTSAEAGTDAPIETNFTVAQALNTRAFWILSAFAAAAFMAQGGISLHQVPHFIHQGLPDSLAAMTAGIYAFAQMPGGVFWSTLSRRVPVRFLLSLTAFVVAAGAIGIAASSVFGWAMAASATMGFGVGGLHLLVRLAWADYYGRQYLGRIRGLTLSAQIGGQALGPVTAGFMFDTTGSYQLPFRVFTIGVFIAGLLALAATPPKRLALVQESTS
jgi:MFS family permease